MPSLNSSRTKPCNKKKQQLQHLIEEIQYLTGCTIVIVIKIRTQIKGFHGNGGHHKLYTQGDVIVDKLEGAMQVETALMVTIRSKQLRWNGSCVWPFNLNTSLEFKNVSCWTKEAIYIKVSGVCTHYYQKLKSWTKVPIHFKAHQVGPVKFGSECQFNLSYILCVHV